MNEIKLATYVTYLAISLPLTLTVGRTLFKHGRAFLLDAFTGNEYLADSVNHLLIVGFYLINCGWVTRSMTTSAPILTGQGGLEFLASRIGAVLMILGFMHFFNLFILSRIRRAGLRRISPPPVLPNEYLQPKMRVEVAS